MATCKLLVIHNGSKHLGAALSYAQSVEKTVHQEMLETPDDTDYMETALDYALNASKTAYGESRYTCGVGVVWPERALDEFRNTWKRFGKSESGRSAYHLIQSFSPEDEVTPEMAQEIGRKMVEKLFPGHQAVIGTHIDRAHTHNHIIINAVNAETGSKLHFQKTFLDNEIRRQSDELCRQYGLSVIKRDPSKKKTSYRTGSYREILMKDLHYCLRQSEDLAEALLHLEDFGYEVDTSRKWIRIKPPEAERWIRIDDKEDAMPEVRHIKGMLRTRDPSLKLRSRAEDLSGWQAEMLRYVVILGQQKTNRRVYITVGEYRNIHRRTQGLQYIASQKIRSQADLSDRQKEVESKLAGLKRERYKLIGTKRRMSKLYEADKILAHPQLHTEAEVRKAEGVMERTDLSREQIRSSRLKLDQDMLAVREETRSLRRELEIIKNIWDAQPNVRAALARENQERARISSQKDLEQRLVRTKEHDRPASNSINYDER